MLDVCRHVEDERRSLVCRSEPGKPTLADWLDLNRKSIAQFQRQALKDPDVLEAQRQVRRRSSSPFQVINVLRLLAEPL